MIRLRTIRAIPALVVLAVALSSMPSTAIAQNFPSKPVRIVDERGASVFTRGHKVSVFLEIEGAGHYLPKYAGNLDIMTSAALRTGERLAAVHSARPVMA